MPRLSVVIPVYNVEDFLEPCLDSVLAQTFTDYEVVMVNDGSTDRSAEIAQRYADLDNRFRVVHQENGGLSKARNTGSDEAGGGVRGVLHNGQKLAQESPSRALGA